LELIAVDNTGHLDAEALANLSPDRYDLDYFTGLDLGQARDYTALAVIERSRLAPPPTTLHEQMGGRRVHDKPPPTFSLVHLHRWQLGTSYCRIVEDLRDLLNRPRKTPPTYCPLKDCFLVVDATGCGRPVVDQIRAAKLPCRLRPVLITGGHQAHYDELTNYWHVPKLDLAGSLVTLLQQRRLRWDPELPHADTLRRELTTFHVKPTAAGNLTAESWREKDHDDLVFAVAFACWYAARPSRILDVW
jgi:hypothetical protein